MSPTKLIKNDEKRPSLVFFDDGSRGWGPIEHFSHLATRLLGLDLQRPPVPATSRWSMLRGMSLTATKCGPAPGVIYLVKSPSSVKALTQLEDFFVPRRFRVLWIVDSFWTEWAPSARLMRRFDLVVYMQKGEADFYERLAPQRTLYLGWGTDALDLGSAATERQFDVLRVGRQPEAWEDDARTLTACKAHGLRFAGRPPFLPENPDDPSAGHRDLCARYAQAKFVIAHSNLAAPAAYTHPTKEYLTGRWTDGLAAGAVIAGAQPFGDVSAEDLLWPGATLAFDRIDLAHNIEMLREAVAIWTPTVATRNRREALIRLDWRWRLKALTDALGLTVPALEIELDRLNAAIASFS